MLELEQAKKRAAELRALIEYNNRLYYDQDAPEQIGRASCRERV